MLALSTSCVPSDWPLPRAVAALRAFDVRGLALHRPPLETEARELSRLLRATTLVAVFGEAPGAAPAPPLLVVEGAPPAQDREHALLELCRRLHALRPVPVAVRAAGAPDGVPSPAELPLLLSEVPQAGYWHDAGRAGEPHLAAAGDRLRGASYDPLGDVDLALLRDALRRGHPAVVACPPGTPKREVTEALARARAHFRA